jgi:hypothetical protein
MQIYWEAFYLTRPAFCFFTQKNKQICFFKSRLLLAAFPVATGLQASASL